MDDGALWQAWRGGDQRAGEQLFERYFDAIYGFFDRRVNADVADLVQRTFLGCVEARDRFRGASTFRTFIFAIARNELFAHYRAQKRGAEIDFGVSSVADLSPSPSALARQRSDQERLLDALRALPVDMQLALELRFWEDLSGPELAVILDVAEGTVRSRLRRGIEALRSHLEGDGGGDFLQLSPGEELEDWAGRLAKQFGL